MEPFQKTGSIKRNKEDLMSKGRRWALIAATCVSFMLSGVLAGQAMAQYPRVANLQPFSAEANFMSLPGYLRYLNFLQEKTWISREEATRIVKQQMGG
jgi:hypothetical protein